MVSRGQAFRERPRGRSSLLSLEDGDDDEDAGDKVGFLCRRLFASRVSFPPDPSETRWVAPSCVVLLIRGFCQ